MSIKAYLDTMDENEVYKYSGLSNFKVYIPKTQLLIPKDSDYERGYYYRYFYRMLNDKNSNVYEINEKEYNKIQKVVYYKKLKIKWKLIGPKDIARDINIKIINVSNQVLFGIKSVLVDPLQFWKNLPDTVIEFDVTNKLPRTEIKKKRFNLNLISVVAFDQRGHIYILTEDLNIIYTEDGYGILFIG